MSMIGPWSILTRVRSAWGSLSGALLAEKPGGGPQPTIWTSRLHFYAFFATLAAHLLVYAPSLFHIFRNDHWTFLYVTREWDFSSLHKFHYIGHMIWFDRSRFIPLGCLFIGFQKCLFGPSYFGHHVLLFILHFSITWTLCKLMLVIQRGVLAYALALMFSLLIGNIDGAVWNYSSVYPFQLLLLLIAIYQFERGLRDGRFTSRRRMLIAALLAASVFVNESGAPLSLLVCLFFLLHRKRLGPLGRGGVQWVILLVLPVLVYGAMYYLNIQQAALIVGPEDPGAPERVLRLRNIMRLPRLHLDVFHRYLFHVLVPTGTQLGYREVTYVSPGRSDFPFSAILLNYACVLVLMAGFWWGARWAVEPPALPRPERALKGRRALFYLLALLGYMTPILLGRSVTYGPDIVLQTSRYMYGYSAFLLLFLYAMVDLGELRSIRRGAVHGAVVASVLVLATLHGIYVRQAVDHMTYLLAPLRSYFDQVHQFVRRHRGEPDFSFKMLTPPPQITFSDYVHVNRCLDGFFHAYKRERGAKYILEFDLEEGKLQVKGGGP